MHEGEFVHDLLILIVIGFVASLLLAPMADPQSFLMLWFPVFFLAVGAYYAGWTPPRRQGRCFLQRFLN